ncbi:glycosyltransferase [Nocardia vermiculata]|uniref:Glycosyltransferase n=1 Tax=Nocardia vermiculata TaxID=257274 RepID=A0A846Y3J4_9NOCA|nr:nucleotide disphospho-sugar-binding domain-containing protein [Nocardia vermiculata]NKY52261.1 glycosyltransferase [Nocardia vermiculata]
MAAEHGVDLSELPNDARLLPAAIGTGHGLVRRWRTGRTELRTLLLAPLAAHYAALSGELARHSYDAVLVDSMFTGAIPLLVSARPRLPVVVCGVGPLTVSSADCPPFGMGWQPRPGRDYTRMNRFVQQVLFRSAQTQLNGILGDLGVGPAPVFLLDWPLLADRMVQFSVPGFEYPRRDLAASVLFAGPVTASPPATSEVPHWLESARRSGRRIVHVTQGTWDNGNPDELLRPAVSALSGRSDVVVVVSTGGTEVSPRRLPEHIRVCDFVPYELLLPHTDLMITNGGYGGVQQALEHGVPVIVAGSTADKPEVAARVAYTGAGIDLGGISPRPSALSAAVDRIFGDVAFRAAAQRLGEEMAGYSPIDTMTAVLAEMTQQGSRVRNDESFATGRQGEQV